MRRAFAHKGGWKGKGKGKEIAEITDQARFIHFQPWTIFNAKETNEFPNTVMYPRATRPLCFSRNSFLLTTPTKVPTMQDFYSTASLTDEIVPEPARQVVQQLLALICVTPHDRQLLQVGQA